MSESHAHVQGAKGGWLEHSLSGIAASVERAVFTEEHARSKGWLQSVDPRAKLGMFLAVVLAASLSRSFWILLALYALILAAGYASRLPFDFFVRRVWTGIPLFAGIVIIPAVFLTTGPRLFEVVLGPVTLGPSVASLMSGLVFLSRVGVSVSLAVLLVLTTPWADLLKSLHAMHTPQVFVLLLSMTYRYIFLFLHAVNGLFEARKSRMVAPSSGNEARRWIGNSMGALMNRSFKMSNDVYVAMLARGFSGQVRSYSQFRMATADWLALGLAVAVAIVAVAVERLAG